MLSKVVRLAHEFRQSAHKSAWLRHKLKWRYFAYRQRTHHSQNLQFDAAHSIDTAGDLALDQAGVSDDQVRAGNGVYRPVTETLFRATLAAVPLPYERYSFIDVGSGKGKVLFMAADYPFQRIVGIEFSPVLHEVAVRNVASYVFPTQQCRNIEAVLGDALTYTPPPGPLFFFTFNALASDIMARWLEGVEDLASREPDRPVIVVYANLRSVKELGNVLYQTTQLQMFRRNRKFVVLANEAARRTFSTP